MKFFNWLHICCQTPLHIVWSSKTTLSQHLLIACWPTFYSKETHLLLPLWRNLIPTVLKWGSKLINCWMRCLLQETVVSNLINYACIICIIYNYYTRLYTTRHARFLQHRTSKNKNLNNVIKFDMDTRVIWIINRQKLCCR